MIQKSAGKKKKRSGKRHLVELVFGTTYLYIEIHLRHQSLILFTKAFCWFDSTTFPHLTHVKNYILGFSLNKSVCGFHFFVILSFFCCLFSLCFMLLCTEVRLCSSNIIVASQHTWKKNAIQNSFYEWKGDTRMKETKLRIVGGKRHTDSVRLIQKLRQVLDLSLATREKYASKTNERKLNGMAHHTMHKQCDWMEKLKTYTNVAFSTEGYYMVCYCCFCLLRVFYFRFLYLLIISQLEN